MRNNAQHNANMMGEGTFPDDHSPRERRPVGSNPRHFRVRYQRAGGHVHVRVFSASAPHLTHGKCGELTFDERDWPAFQACFRDCGEAAVTFVPEDSPPQT